MDWISYFRQLAQAYAPIGGRFATVHAGEYEKVVKNQLDVKQFCLLLELQEGTFSDQKSDNVMEMVTLSFAVIKHVPDDNYATQATTLHQCREHALRLLGRLRRDYSQRLIHQLQINDAANRRVWGYHFSDTVAYEVTIQAGMSVMQFIEYDASHFNQ